MKIILIMCAALLSLTAPAFAQSTSGAISGSAAKNKNINASGAIAAGNSIVLNGNPADTTATTTAKTTYGGSYDVRNVPMASAPGIITAHNCAMGVSAGGSGMGWGVSLGGTYIDEACQLVSQAAALNTLAGRSVAIRHLAKDPAMCDTLLQAGLITGSCGKTAKRKRTSPDQVATASTKAVSAPFSKCSYDPATNKLSFKKRPGVDRNVALAACKQAAGF